MPERKARRQFDCSLGGGDRAIKSVSVGADDGERVMCVRIFLVEPNGRERRLRALLDVIGRRLAPAVSHHSCIDATDPEISFRQFGIKLARLPKQLPRVEVVSRVT